MRWTVNCARLAAVFVGLQLIGAATAVLAAQSAQALYNEAVAAEERLEKSKNLQTDKNAWKKVAQSYRKVVLSHPRSGYCDDALFYEGEIYRQIDKRFRDRDAVRRAMDAYLQLIKGYPSSKWCRKAHLLRADLYLNRLLDRAAAKQELNAVLSRWPEASEATEARRVLATMSPANRTETDRRVAVRNIRHFTGKKYTRIVIDLEDEVKYRQGRLTKPDRIYFDLLGARLSQSLASLTVPIDDGFLRQIRVGQNQSDVVRVVLDFESISEYNVFSLHEPYRLVVDILGIKPAPPTLVARRASPPPANPPSFPSTTNEPPGRGSDPPVPATDPDPKATGVTESGGTEAAAPEISSVDLPLPPEPTSDGRYPLARQLGLSAKRVIIDPGHGGHDPGTTSRSGLKEKDLVLDISRRVAKILERDGEYEVLMTRNDDTYPPLEERTAIANSYEADLFVSIHANAHPSRKVRGIETFYLNLATTPDAEETAARENAVSTRRMGELQDILRQIMNNSRIAESGDFANRVQDSLVQGVLDGSSTGSRNHGVKTAPFYVLLGANMPSVLVEVSYLSNTEDARLLGESAYRQRIAESIADGIRSYTASLKKIARVPAEAPTVGNDPRR